MLFYICYTFNVHFTPVGPYFTLKLHHTTHVIITNELVLECGVTGSTSPLITWYQNSQVVSQEDNRVSITRVNETGNMVLSQLRIQSIQLSDMGVYRCEAENSNGINSTETILNILGN